MNDPYEFLKLKVPDSQDVQIDHDDLVWNLQRIMGYFMGIGAHDAVNAIWWAEQIIKNNEFEYKDAIKILRELCEEFGDNDWEDSLYLADIIEKHLAKYLWATKKGSKNNALL